MITSTGVKRAEEIIKGFMMKGRCLDCGKIGLINKLTCQCEECMKIGVVGD